MRCQTNCRLFRCGLFDPCLNRMSYLEIAAQFIEEFEGLRLEAYRCPAGIWTIGYGHTKRVKEGDTCTESEAIAYLMEDLRDADECIDYHVDVVLTDNQRAALLSFIFNLGCGNFKASTLLKLINQSQFDAAAAQFGRWTKANGKDLPGLVKRREAERALFAS